MRVEYRTDLTGDDLPTVTETLNLGFSLNYIQADSTGVSVKDNGVYNELITFYIEGKEYVAESSMKWAAFVGSKYNVDGFIWANNDDIVTADLCGVIMDPVTERYVKYNEIIIADFEYAFDVSPC